MAKFHDQNGQFERENFPSSGRDFVHIVLEPVTFKRALLKGANTIFKMVQNKKRPMKWRELIFSSSNCM